jgi:hypothetical protein
LVIGGEEEGIEPRMNGHVVIQVFSSCGVDFCMVKDLVLEVKHAGIQISGQAQFSSENFAQRDG